MNTRRTKLGLLAILAGGLSASAMASGFFWDNFESYTVGTNLAALSAQGWGASDASVMVTNNVFGNPTNMAALPPNTVLTNTVGMAPGAPGKIWTDCLIDETMRVDPISLPLLESNTMVMAGVTTDGFAAVYNTASNGWDICTNDARGSAVAGLSAAAWARLSLCEDFASNQVALFLNGRLLRQGIPFITNQTSYAQVTFSSGDSSTGYVDEVYVSNAVPATLAGQAPSSTNDINGDGIVDAVEIMQYGAIAKMVPGDIATITGAVAAAHAGDRIVVSNGTYATSFTLSNGVTLIRGILSANATNLTIQGNVTVGTGTVVAVSGVFTVTGQVTIADGGLLTISNTVANFGGLSIGGGGFLHVVNGALIVGGYTNTASDFTLSLVTNMVSAGVGGSITPSGTSTMISTWSNVTYSLTADPGYLVGALTNNGADVGGALVGAGEKTATYTDPAANITNDQIITAAFIYNGIRYVPSDYGTIGAALAAAQSGDQIVVSDGMYAETLVVGNSVKLFGTNVTGLAGVTVQANQNLVLSGFSSFVVTNLVIQSGATVVVSNGTAVTVGGVTLTGPFTMNSAWATALTRSSINFTNDFEAYSLSQPLALCGGQGWGASESGSIIQDSVFTNGAKAALVVSHSELSNTVSAATLNKVWSDVWLNDSAVKYSESAYPETNGNLAVMVFVNTNNRVVIWNSTAWDECALDVAGNNAPVVSTGTWVRVSIFEDFTAQKVALFVNGQLLRQQVPFVSPVTSYHGLSLSSGDGEAYMDDVKIWTNMPPGLTSGANCDLDRDGIPDALEIQNYGNLALSLQGSIYTIR
jgi:hypothetical protein